MKYNCIVVGGGSAGCVLAARLSEDPKRSVVLLEAGPDYPDFEKMPMDLKDGNNIWRTAYGPHSRVFQATATPCQKPVGVPRGRVIGGSSSINGQVFFRGLPEDYDNWAAAGNQEWGFAKVLPYFRKLETDLDFPDAAFHGNDGPTPVRRYQRHQWLPCFRAFHEACLGMGFPERPDQNHPECHTGVSARPLNNVNGVRMGVAWTYLKQARQRPNLTVLGSVDVNRVLFAGARAVGVEVQRNGDVRIIQGDHVVLCAGAVGSPQLLMLSGVGPARQLSGLGINVVHELPGVGANLRDHPACFLLFRGKGKPLPDRAPAMQLNLRFSMEESPTRGDFQLDPILMSSEHRPASVNITSDAFHFGCSLALQNATSAGLLRLTCRDPRAQPELNFDFLSAPYDRQRMRAALRFAVKVFEHPAFNDVIAQRLQPLDVHLATNESLEAWMRNVVYTQHHMCGTSKKGPASDSMAVVDQYCHVHGMKNLSVVDASVMPDVIRANTNATTMMIAERVADWMR